MRNVISAAAVAGFGLCGTNLVSDSAAVARPVPVLLVFTQPPVARLDQSALLTVRGVRLVRQIRVRLRGSTTAIGLLAPWLPLRFHAGEWTARLPPLEHRGVYPIELRREPGGRILQSKRWLFRVLARGTLARPAFTSPIEVVRWWVQVVRHGTLVAIKPWRFRTSNSMRSPVAAR
jgi:hypothetical protein